MKRTFLFLFVSVVTWPILAQNVAPPPGQSFDSAGVPIHYTVEGEGEPVILLHGFAMAAPIQWRVSGVAGALAKEFQVITVDNRGHGKSGKPHDPKQYGGAMADDVIRLMGHLNIKKAHLVGYSLGAFITLKVATTHPERVQSAILGGAGWLREGDPNWNVGEELAASLEQGKGIWPLLRELHPADEGPFNPDGPARGVNFLLTASNDVRALAACVRGMPGLNIPPEALESNKIPMLALIGSRDPLKEKTVDPMLEKLTNVQLKVIDGTDHSTTFLDVRFLPAIQTFLKESSGSLEKRQGAAETHSDK